MSKDINVVAALIFKDNKVLIAKRSTDKDAKGKWEFPGGKVEENEDEKIAIEREIYEEFDVKVKTKDFISQSTFNYPHGNVILKLYECEYIDGNFKLHAHSEYAWVKIDDLLNYDLAPADIPLAKDVMERYK